MSNRREPGSNSGALPTVSVVIPTFNNAGLLREALVSVAGLSYPLNQLETIVVDNGSADGTPHMLQSRFPDVKHLRLEHNTGFAGACNRGAAEASGEYVAFLNDDAVAEPGWIHALLKGLFAGGEGAVCAASHIRTGDGKGTEYTGASANLFGVGRPRSVWGWSDAPQPPGEGSPLLFASGGAMLIHRRTFLDVGGFDPEYFAYFEDVDLGWRLWVLGHRVVYAPGAIARHKGGATGLRSGAHRRYTLWEANSLATVLKNYEGGNVERFLTAALLLLYRRALLSAGNSFDLEEYKVSGRADTNKANTETWPKVSVAHLAAIERFSSRLPHFMAERRRIQERRRRSDAEILPLLGNLWEPQFAGAEYAEAVHTLRATLRLDDLSGLATPRRVLIVSSQGKEQTAADLASRLLTHAGDQALFALAVITGSGGETNRGSLQQHGVIRHNFAPEDPSLQELVKAADAIVLLLDLPSQLLKEAIAPILSLGYVGTQATDSASQLHADDTHAILAFCLKAKQGTAHS